MSQHIKIQKGDRHFTIEKWEEGYFISREDGEGMEVKPEVLYDFLNKFFEETM